MKNKKLILVIAAVLIITTLVFAFAGCNNDKGLTLNKLKDIYNSKTENADTFAISSVSSLDNLTVDTFLGSGFVIAHSTDTETAEITYSLIDAVNNKTVATAPESFFSALGGLVFYTQIYDIDADITTYTYYGADGVLKTSQTPAVAVNNTLAFDDNTYIEIDKDNKAVLKEKKDGGLSVPSFADMDEELLYKTAKGYYFLDDNIVVLLDKEKNYINSVNLNKEINFSVDAEEITFNEMDNKIFFSELVPLPEDAESYDVTDGSKIKMNLRQGFYNVDTGAITSIPNNKHYFVETKIDDNLYLGGYIEINDKKYDSTKCAIFDSNLKIVLDTDKYLANGEIYYYFGDYVVFRNSYLYAIYKGEKKVAVFDTTARFEDGMVLVNGKYYTYEGKLAYEPNPANTPVSFNVTTEGLYYYTTPAVYNEETGETTGNEFVMYNMNAGTETKLGSDTKKYNEDMFITQTVADGVTTTNALYYAANGKAIFEKQAYTNIEVRTALGKSLIICTDAEGGTCAYLLVR